MAKLGQQVDVYCGKCKVERYHTVAALNDSGGIDRIVCDYCSSPRKYRDPSATRRTKSTMPRARSKSSRPTVLELQSDARPYSPRTSFKLGDVINHSKYGFGKVTAVRGDRIDVFFWDGPEKTFLHVPTEE